MFITVTMKMGDNKYNLKIDNSQPIINAVQILRESKKYNGETALFYRSKLSQNVVSGYLSFKDAEIFSGDVLEIIYN